MMISTMKMRAADFNKTFGAQVAIKLLHGVDYSFDVVMDKDPQTSNEVYTVIFSDGIPKVRTYGPAFAPLDYVFKFFISYTEEVGEKLMQVAEPTLFMYRAALTHKYPDLDINNIEQQLNTVADNAGKYSMYGEEEVRILVAEDTEGGCVAKYELISTVFKITSGNPKFVTAVPEPGLRAARLDQLLIDVWGYATTYAAYLFKKSLESVKKETEDVQQSSENGSSRPDAVGDACNSGHVRDEMAVGTAVERGDYELPVTENMDSVTADILLFREDIQKVKVKDGAVEKCVAARAGSELVLLHKDIYGKITVTLPPDTDSMDLCELEDTARSRHYPIGKRYMDILLDELRNV